MPANVYRPVAPQCKRQIIGWHWPAMEESGAGDGNRKYRSGVNKYFASMRYALGRALGVIFV
jgi:hypothetical protein